MKALLFNASFSRKLSLALIMIVALTLGWNDGPVLGLPGGVAHPKTALADGCSPTIRQFITSNSTTVFDYNQNRYTDLVWGLSMYTGHDPLGGVNCVQWLLSGSVADNTIPDNNWLYLRIWLLPPNVQPTSSNVTWTGHQGNCGYSYCFVQSPIESFGTVQLYSDSWGVPSYISGCQFAFNGNQCATKHWAYVHQP